MASPLVRSGTFSPSTIGDTLTNNSIWTQPFPNASGAPSGQTIAVFMKFSSSLGSLASGLQVTDDAGNTYTGKDGGWDSTHSIGSAAFYSINITGPVTKIFVKNVSGDAMSDFTVWITEGPDIASFDTSSNNTGSGTAMTTGSITPAGSGEYFMMMSFRTGTGADVTTSFTPTTHANITWKKVSSNINEGMVLQTGVYNSTSAITPQCDAGTTTTGWVTVCLVFVTGTSGQGVPDSSAGVFIRGIHHTGILNPNPNPVSIEFPANGNLGVIMNSGGLAATNGIVTSVTDNKSNTWTLEPIAQNDANSAIIWAPLTTIGDDLVLTVNLNNGLGDLSYNIYDVQGVTSSPKVVFFSNTGNQSVTAPLTALSHAPAASGNLVMVQVSWASGTADSMVDPTQTFDAITWGSEPVDGPTNVDENNGWAHMIARDRLNRPWTFHRTAASIGAGNWESTGIEFQSLAALTSTGKTFKRNLRPAPFTPGIAK